MGRGLVGSQIILPLHNEDQIVYIYRFQLCHVSNLL